MSASWARGAHHLRPSEKCTPIAEGSLASSRHERCHTFVVMLLNSCGSTGSHSVPPSHQRTEWPTARTVCDDRVAQLRVRVGLIHQSGDHYFFSFLSFFFSSFSIGGTDEN